MTVFSTKHAREALDTIARGIRPKGPRAVQAGWNQPLESHDMQSIAEQALAALSLLKQESEL